MGPLASQLTGGGRFAAGSPQTSMLLLVGPLGAVVQQQVLGSDGNAFVE